MTTGSRAALFLGSSLCWIVLDAGARAAPAPVLTTLVAFDGTNGSLPADGLTTDLAGNLYGTTSFGGAGGGEFGQGTVFELSGADHTILTTLATFDGSNGAGPQGGLTFDIFGNLYGTTGAGGSAGTGTAFRLSGPSHQTLTTLASFTGNDGANPFCGVTLYAAGTLHFPGLPNYLGDLFGTTDAGGASGNGTVYELSGSNHETLTSLLSFTGANGSRPDTRLVADAAGNLYGTTTSGGPNGFGTVFELSGPHHTKLTTLAAFDGVSASGPRGGLTLDSAGNLYGTTEGGGPAAGGTIFELSGPSHQTFTTLATFGLYDPNGAAPESGLLIDAAGNLFGTTTGGGVDFAPANLGSIFKLSADHRTLTRLYRFTGGQDGDIPVAGLVADLAGNLYGTTSSGGSSGSGTVFKLSNSGFVTIFDLLSSSEKTTGSVRQ